MHAMYTVLMTCLGDVWTRAYNEYSILNWLW